MGLFGFNDNFNFKGPIEKREEKRKKRALERVKRGTVCSLHKVKYEIQKHSHR